MKAVITNGSIEIIEEATPSKTRPDEFHASSWTQRPDYVVTDRGIERFRSPSLYQAVKKAVALCHRPKKRSFTVEHNATQALVDYFDYGLDGEEEAQDAVRWAADGFLWEERELRSWGYGIPKAG